MIIGREHKVNGAVGLSEMLKRNTTLSKLSIKGKSTEIKMRKKHIYQIMNGLIGTINANEVAKALGEALKVNTTLTSLNLGRG